MKEYEIIVDRDEPIEIADELKKRTKNRNDRVKYEDEFIMISERTYKMIDVIKIMDEKEKIRLAICLADSSMSIIRYDKKEMLKNAYSKL